MLGHVNAESNKECRGRDDYPNEKEEENIMK